MTGTPPGEPTLADVQAQYPAWQCGRAVSGMYFADQPATGQQVTGEDPSTCAIRSRPQKPATPGAPACDSAAGNR